AVIAGGMPGGQLAGGAEEVGDGAAAGGEDRRDGQDQEALIGGVVEDRSERGEDGLGEVGYNEHEGHLVEGPWGVGLPLSLTRWSDLANSAGPLRIPSRGRSQAEYYSVKSYEHLGGLVRMINMNKTHTPELSPEVLQRLRAYAARFEDLFRHPAQRAWSDVYLRGLLQDGERKSIEPMVGRVARPAELLEIRDPEQALQQFVNQSPWDDQEVQKRYRSVMAEPLASPQGIFVIDDTGSPKQGKHSVGVQRQSCGQLGKKANCQVAVTVHYVSPEGHFPAALRLYLPKSWTAAPKRLEAAKVPESFRAEKTKGRIALELLDQVRGEGRLPGNLVI